MSNLQIKSEELYFDVVADGYSTATINLYKRASSQPTGAEAKPTGNLVYTFSDATLTVPEGDSQSLQDLLNGWTTNLASIISDAKALYIIQTIVNSQDASVTITKEMWTEPALFTQDGAQGPQGDSNFLIEMSPTNYTFDATNINDKVYGVVTVSYGKENLPPDNAGEGEYYWKWEVVYDDSFGVDLIKNKQLEADVMPGTNQGAFALRAPFLNAEFTSANGEVKRDANGNLLIHGLRTPSEDIAIIFNIYQKGNSVPIYTEYRIFQWNSINYNYDYSLKVEASQSTLTFDRDRNDEAQVINLNLFSNLNYDSQFMVYAQNQYDGRTPLEVRYALVLANPENIGNREFFPSLIDTSIGTKSVYVERLSTELTLPLVFNSPHWNFAYELMHPTDTEYKYYAKNRLVDSNSQEVNSGHWMTYWMLYDTWTMESNGYATTVSNELLTINWDTRLNATLYNTFNALTNNGKQQGIFYALPDPENLDGYIKVTPNTDGTFTTDTGDIIPLPPPEGDTEDTTTTEDVDLYVNASMLHVQDDDGNIVFNANAQTKKVQIGSFNIHKDYLTSTQGYFDLYGNEHYLNDDDNRPVGIRLGQEIKTSKVSISTGAGWWELQPDNVVKIMPAELESDYALISTSDSNTTAAQMDLTVREYTDAGYIFKVLTIRYNRKLKTWESLSSVITSIREEKIDGFSTFYLTMMNNEFIPDFSTFNYTISQILESPGAKTVFYQNGDCQLTNPVLLGNGEFNTLSGDRVENLSYLSTNKICLAQSETETAAGNRYVRFFSPKYARSKDSCHIFQIANNKVKNPSEPIKGTTNGLIFYIDDTGDIYTIGDIKSKGNIEGSTVQQTTSDINLKNSIINLSSQHDVLFDNLQGVTYKYNDGTSGRTHIGFIAQQATEAANQAGIELNDFAPVCIGEDGVWRLRYEEFIALNTDQIQKAKKRISALEDENARLKTILGLVLENDFVAAKALLYQ